MAKPNQKPMIGQGTLDDADPLSARFYYKCHSIREADCLQQHTQQKTVVLQAHGGAGSREEFQPEEGKSSNGHKWIPVKESVK